MSRRFVLVLLLLGGGAWFFAKNYRLEGLQHLRVHRRIPSESMQLNDVLPVTRQGDARPADESNFVSHDPVSRIGTL